MMQQVPTSGLLWPDCRSVRLLLRTPSSRHSLSPIQRAAILHPMFDSVWGCCWIECFLLVYVMVWWEVFPKKLQGNNNNNMAVFRGMGPAQDACPWTLELGTLACAKEKLHY